jgi:lysophospholipase L1-like esterase
MQLQSGERFLLIGDSITDAGRFEDPEGVGFGYVRMFRDLLHTRYPERTVEIVNRGISGDTIRHLDQRWQRDVIAENPDVLSVSIGVNDVWRQLQFPPNPEEVFLEEFEATYRRLLSDTRRALPCRLLLCEATIIGETREAPHNAIIDGYNEYLAKLACEFDALLVPMNQTFWRVIDANPAWPWTTDGVHPLSNGHMLMAVTLFQALGGTLP